MAFAVADSGNAHTIATNFDTGIAVTGAINTTGANFISIAISTYLMDPSTSNISDSKGNTWNKLASYVSGNAADVTEFYSVPTSVGSGHTFTINFTGAFPTIGVIAFTGAAASPYDNNVVGANTDSTSIAPGSITPSQDNEVVITAFTFNTDGTITAPSGFTLTDIQQRGGINIGLALAYKIQTSAGAENPSWSTSASGIIGATQASFKAAGGAIVSPAGNTKQFLMLMGLGT